MGVHTFPDDTQTTSLNSEMDRAGDNQHKFPFKTPLLIIAGALMNIQRHRPMHKDLAFSFIKTFRGNGNRGVDKGSCN